MYSINGLLMVGFSSLLFEIVSVLFLLMDTKLEVHTAYSKVEYIDILFKKSRAKVFTFHISYLLSISFQKMLRLIVVIAVTITITLSYSIENRLISAAHPSFFPIIGDGNRRRRGIEENDLPRPISKKPPATFDSSFDILGHRRRRMVDENDAGIIQKDAAFPVMAIP